MTVPDICVPQHFSRIDVRRSYQPEILYKNVCLFIIFLHVIYVHHSRLARFRDELEELDDAADDIPCCSAFSILRSDFRNSFTLIS